MQLVLLVLARRDEQNGRVSLLACRAAQREAVRARQHDVEQQQVEPPGFDQVQRRVAVRRSHDRKIAAALRGEVVGQHLTHGLLILGQ